MEGGEVSVAEAEVESKKTTKIKPATEQGSASNETSQAYESERYQRSNLIIEKRFSASEKDLWPLRSIDLTVSQNGQKLRMNDLLPEGWAIVEDLFGTEPLLTSRSLWHWGHACIATLPRRHEPHCPGGEYSRVREIAITT